MRYTVQQYCYCIHTLLLLQNFTIFAFNSLLIETYELITSWFIIKANITFKICNIRNILQCITNLAVTLVYYMGIRRETNMVNIYIFLWIIFDKILTKKVVNILAISIYFLNKSNKKVCIWLNEWQRGRGRAEE